MSAIPMKAALAGLLFVSTTALAQAQDASPEPQDQTATTEDEVIAYGKIYRDRHKGMSAFLDGDFETAEIEFEREFKSLKRFESGRENAAFDAEIGANRTADLSAAQASPSANVGQNGTTPVQQGFSDGSIAFSSNFSNKRKEGGSVLLDGRVTYQDFAVTSYMSGLSEIKLGKYDEAKKSLKRSLHYDGDNHDARMRLGLLYLQEGDIQAAAKQLEKIDKIRRECKKLTACEETSYINDSAKTLSEQIMATVG